MSESWWLTCKTREEFNRIAYDETRLNVLRHDKTHYTGGWEADQSGGSDRIALKGGHYARQFRQPEQTAASARQAAAERAARGIRDAGLL